MLNFDFFFLFVSSFDVKTNTCSMQCNSKFTDYLAERNKKKQKAFHVHHAS